MLLYLILVDSSIMFCLLTHFCCVLLQKKYQEFQDVLEKNSVNAKSSVSRNHAPTVEVLVGFF